MRISDWSSDVCSSDRLDIDERVGGVGGAFEIDQRDPARIGLGEHCVDFRAAGPGGKIEKMNAELAEHARDQRFGGGIERPRVDDRVAGLDHRERSEEHTSELQSLMRISYAVFCFTQKTRRRVITQYEQQ